MLSADRPGGKCTVEFEQMCGDFPDFEDVKSGRLTLWNVQNKFLGGP